MPQPPAATVHVAVTPQPRFTSPAHLRASWQTFANVCGIHASASLPPSPLELDELDELLEDPPPSPLLELEELELPPSLPDELVELERPPLPELIAPLLEDVPTDVLPLEPLDEELLAVSAAGRPSGNEMPQPNASPTPKKHANST
jgi:hypothetical protein